MEDPVLSYSESLAKAATILANISSHDDRISILEELGTYPLGPLHFVDDGSGPYATVRDVAAIVHNALPQYEQLVKAKFNFEPNKTAVLPMMDADTPCDAEFGCSIAYIYKCLGVKTDAGLTFEPRLKQVVSIGHAVFRELHHVAESVGLPIPMIAAQVTVRLVPLVLFACEVLALVPSAEKKLNRLQACWAKRLLGAAKHTDLRAALSVIQCGWTQRLGTMMWERSIITLARIQLFPLDHPAAMMALLAEDSNAPTWYSTVRDEMSSNAKGYPIPPICKCTLFPRHLLNQARSDKAIRKNILRRYRLEIVRVKLQHRDTVAFQRDAEKTVFSLNLRFCNLVPSPCIRLNEMHDVDAHPVAWKHF